MRLFPKPIVPVFEPDTFGMLQEVCVKFPLKEALRLILSRKFIVLLNNKFDVYPSDAKTIVSVYVVPSNYEPSTTSRDFIFNRRVAGLDAEQIS